MKLAMGSDYNPALESKLREKAHAEARIQHGLPGGILLSPVTDDRFDLGMAKENPNEEEAALRHAIEENLGKQMSPELKLPLYDMMKDNLHETAVYYRDRQAYHKRTGRQHFEYS